MQRDYHLVATPGPGHGAMQALAALVRPPMTDSPVLLPLLQVRGDRQPTSEVCSSLHGRPHTAWVMSHAHTHQGGTTSHIL